MKICKRKYDPIRSNFTLFHLHEHSHISQSSSNTKAWVFQPNINMLKNL